MHALTPPYHFSIVASPLSPPPLPPNPSTATPASPSPLPPCKEILYRGSIPAARNYRFVNRLRLKTLVYLGKKPIKQDDPLGAWAESRGIELKWVKAEKMTEEKLGMGKVQVGEVLRIILDPTCYPVYLADKDGVSHTTLVVACLRKMMGWHLDSVVGEMCRFEPEHEDYSLVPFITSYSSAYPSTSSSSSSSSSTATAASTDSLVLPPPPYPSWLWPQGPGSLSLAHTSTRERATSTTQSPSSSNPLLPFPHPLSARKHPTMKMTFPAHAGPGIPSQSPLSPTLSSRDPNIPASVGTAQLDGLPHGSSSVRNPLSRVATRNDRLSTTDENRSDASPAFSDKLPAAAQGPPGSLALGPSVNDSEQIGVNTMSSSRPSATPPQPSGSVYVDVLGLQSDQPLSAPAQALITEMNVEPGPADDWVEDQEEEEDEEEEEEEEEEEDEDEDLQPTSQYISALDLAGY